MRILVTGSSGRLGTALLERLGNSDEIIPYDLECGNDICDAHALTVDWVDCSKILRAGCDIR